MNDLVITEGKVLEGTDYTPNLLRCRDTSLLVYHDSFAAEFSIETDEEIVDIALTKEDLIKLADWCYAKITGNNDVGKFVADVSDNKEGESN